MVASLLNTLKSRSTVLTSHQFDLKLPLEVSRQITTGKIG